MINNKESEQSWMHKGQEYLINWIDYSINYYRLDEEYQVTINSIEMSIYDDELGDYIPFDPSPDLLVTLTLDIEQDIDWDEHESIERDYFDGINF
jgi:hypothetical protein